MPQLTQGVQVLAPDKRANFLLAQQQSVVVDQFTITTSNCELEIEVDCVEDGDFGDLYRVWKSDRLIGTYHLLC